MNGKLALLADVEKLCVAAVIREADEKFFWKRSSEPFLTSKGFYNCFAKA